MYCACLNVSVEVSQAGKIQKIQTYATKLGVDSTISSEKLLPSSVLLPTTKESTTTTLPSVGKLKVKRSLPISSDVTVNLPETKLCRQSAMDDVKLPVGTKEDPVDLEAEAAVSDESESGSAEELSVFTSDDESDTESEGEECPDPGGCASMQS